jgi:hypothetical protein
MEIRFYVLIEVISPIQVLLKQYLEEDEPMALFKVI